MPTAEHCRPDFYIAAIGRSGSTLLCDWLTNPPDQIVLSEPFFFSDINPAMLRIQLENLGYLVSEADWKRTDASWRDRFARLFEPFLSTRSWGFKEVLALEHERVMVQFSPRRVIISVRDIRDIAASFLEKHKIQRNTHRFDHRWVREYCLTESEGLVAFCEGQANGEASLRVQRYEDFVLSVDNRTALARFVGWRGGGETGRHHGRLNREFEIERHGTAVSASQRQWQERDLTDEERQLAEEIAEQCVSYQRFFGYS